MTGTTPAPTIEVGLGTRSKIVGKADLEPVIAALDRQIRRDLAPVWNVSARISLLDDPDNVAAGISPLIIVDEMPGTMKGVHASQNGVAFAMILAADGWSLSASHECIEMLVDPSGAATRAGRALEIVDGTVRDAEGTVDYILEACDPVEDESLGYLIDGVRVSDFYTPHYFDEAVTTGLRYSHTGGITRPREVARNGYLSWREPQSGLLRQLRFFDAPEIVTLGPSPASMTAADGDHVPTLRGFVDARTETPRTRKMRGQAIRIR